MIKPRRSLVLTDVVSHLEAEDLSRTGRHQGQELGQRSGPQFWQSVQDSSRPVMRKDQLATNSFDARAVNAETGRSAAHRFTDDEMLSPVGSRYWSVESWRGNESGTADLRPSAAESGSSAGWCWSGGQTVPHSADDIDGWSSTSVVGPVQSSAMVASVSCSTRPVQAQLSHHQPLHTPSLPAPGLHPGSVLQLSHHQPLHTPSLPSPGLHPGSVSQLSHHQPLHTPSLPAPDLHPGSVSQLSHHQPLHTPSLLAPGLHPGSVSDSHVVRNASAAGPGPTRHVTFFLPTDDNSAPKSLPPNVSPDSERFQSGVQRDSSAGMSLRSPDLPLAVRARGPAASWPNVRGLAEQSPVATVKPQVQMTGPRPALRPPGMVLEHPEEDIVGRAEAPSEPAAPQTRKRKRKRRTMFGTRRRRRKTQQTSNVTANQHSSTPTQAVENPPITGKEDRATTVLDTRVKTSKSSSPAYSASAASTSSLSTMRRALQPIENQQRSSQFFASDSRPSVLQRDVLGATRPTPTTSYTKQQQSSADVQKVPTTGDTGRPSLAQRNVSGASWLAANPTTAYIKQQKSSAGLQEVVEQRGLPITSRMRTEHSSTSHNTPMASYMKQQRSSADVQKVPSTSPPHDVFEFCGDDDELGLTAARLTPKSAAGPTPKSAAGLTLKSAAMLTPKSFRDTPAQLVRRWGWSSADKTLLVVNPAHQKRAKFGNFISGRRLR